MNDFDSELDARIRLALNAAANQITPESLTPSTARSGGSVTAIRPSRARWLAPVLAAAAVAAVIVGTVAVVTSPSASGPRGVQPGAPTDSLSGSTTQNTAPQTPANQTVTASPVETGAHPSIVCTFADVPGCSEPSYYVPMWPFATYADALSWAKSGNGSQPWHLDPGMTALNFTRSFLGFTDITQVTSTVIKGTDAHIGVGYLNPNDKPHTAAVLHLVRYGSSDGGWEVVGSDDTDFSLEGPEYGTRVSDTFTARGHITGVDENIVIQVLASDGRFVTVGTASTPAGGENSPWAVPVTIGAGNDSQQGVPLVIVAVTGGHLQQHERFAIQGVYV